jgi:hypothetical protein
MSVPKAVAEVGVQEVQFRAWTYMLQAELHQYMLDGL